MNHLWQQPIRPLEMLIPNTVNLWATVLFIRPRTDHGWEVMTTAGLIWSDQEAKLRHARLDD